ncbi:hypothetical protein B0A55_11806 [Friedmanniomyces simplex]|uniref:CN hydrolase domain-containing protein n=1 Tax=Friedmanniomyces simplex TaxID=329884 RepID=A0A4V5NBB1_9PEZI|nr:hypothetical protein B0A55_11806 [Friedmanniomyces simplex]
MLTARCFENTCAIIFANAGGPPGKGYAGLSQVCVPYAGAITRLGSSAEGMAVVDLDMKIVEDAELNYQVRADLARADWHYGVCHSSRYHSTHLNTPEARLATRRNHAGSSLPNPDPDPEFNPASFHAKDPDPEDPEDPEDPRVVIVVVVLPKLPDVSHENGRRSIPGTGTDDAPPYSPSPIPPSAHSRTVVPEAAGVSGKGRSR